MFWIVVGVTIFYGHYCIVQKMFLDIAYSLYLLISRGKLSVSTNMIAFVHVVYCCDLSFCRPVTTLLVICYLCIQYEDNEKVGIEE